MSMNRNALLSVEYPGGSGAMVARGSRRLKLAEGRVLAGRMAELV
jgi:hypothetical protein